MFVITRLQESNVVVADWVTLKNVKQKIVYNGLLALIQKV